MIKQKLTGTKEWAHSNVNIQTGCENNCLYCYAKKIAFRYKRIQSEEDWKYPQFNRENYLKQLMRKKPTNGRIMFPSSHDISISNWRECHQVIYHLLIIGNDIILVSKPKLAAMLNFFTDDMLQFKDQLEFRFTIGFWDNHTQMLWEPEAPPLWERLQCVERAVQKGFTVSISMEPLLETQPEIIEDMLQYFVSQGISEIWIGAMNYTKNAPKLNYNLIYQTFKAWPEIKWKESFRKHLK